MSPIDRLLRVFSSLRTHWRAQRVPTRWLLAGLAIRLAIAPYTYSRDFWFFVRAADFTTSNPMNLLNLVFWSYPPPHLWVLFFIYNLWVALPLDHTLLIHGTIPPLGSYYIPYPIHNFLIDPTLVGLLKLPMISADIITGVLILGALRRFGASEPRAKLAFNIWMINPISIWISSASGHFDSIPTLFALYALISAADSKMLRSSISLGLGGAWKLWPFLLLPVLLQFRREPLVQNVRRTLRRQIPIIILVLAPISLITAFYLLARSPLALRAYDPSNKPVYLDILLGYIVPIEPLILGGLPLTLTGLVIFATIVMVADYKISFDVANGLILSELLLIISLSPIHLQHIIWPVPFLLIDWILHPERLWLFIINSAVFLTLLILGLDLLGFGFYFAAIIPESTYSILMNLFSNFTLASVLRAFLAGSSFLYILIILYPLLKNIYERQRVVASLK